MTRRVMVIGLDCAPPALVFDRLRPALPNLSRLIDAGAHGPLRSVMPPITVPAWACMTSGRDPGELGLYGFRNRVPGTYRLTVADANAIEAPRVWDVLSEAGKRVAVLYVPLTSPPPRVEGVAVGCFLASPGAAHTYPEALGATLEARFGPHRPDVTEHRAAAAEQLLDELYDTGRQHFEVARALWREEKPDFLMMVEMGTDRVHHALWKHLDPSHPAHDPDSPLVREARDYYAFLDAQIGALLAERGDDTAVMVVSDHGARTMTGGFRLNEWLRREGWLVLKREPEEEGALEPSLIDWSKTRAWGAGGYYGRLFLNVRGREPEGIVDDREAARLELEAALIAARPEGSVVVHRPEQIYRAERGFAPDLLCVFDDLATRSLGSVGGSMPVEVAAGDTTEDGCNHDWDGVFVLEGAEARGRIEGLSIHDVGPTILSLLDVPTPDGWLGTDRSGGSR